MRKGIDVSKHNGVIDWRKVKADGIDFAIIRAGYARVVDNKFKDNIKGAQAAGVSVGVYWFSYALTVTQAIDEAEFCATTIKPYKLDLPVYFDFEYDTERYAKQNGVIYYPRLRTDIHNAFCNRIKEHGYAAGIYTNVDYILSKIIWSELSQHTLWLAQWPHGEKPITHSTVSESAVNTKYGKPSVWQIGLGAVDGIKGNVDLNYGYMALADKPVIAPVAPVAPFKVGDKVKVLNTSNIGLVRRGVLYGGAGSFVVYRDSYDVISVRGDRVVIGVGKTVTAAVDAKNLARA